MSGQDNWNNYQGQYGYTGNQQPNYSSNNQPWSSPGPEIGSGGNPTDYGHSYGNQPYPTPSSGQGYQEPSSGQYAGSQSPYPHQYSQGTPVDYQQQHHSPAPVYKDPSDPATYPAQPPGTYDQFRQDPYNQPGASPQPYPSGPGYPSSGPAQQNPDDRGIAGALVGGALGAYGGHQVHHGVIGGIGGAIAGSKLEDHYKDKKKKKAHKSSWFGGHSRQRSGSSSDSSSSSSDDDKKKPKKYGMVGVGVGAGAGAAAYAAHHYNQQQQQPPPPPQHQVSAPLAGNFSASSMSITLDHDYDLIASCLNVRGESSLSSISLNNHLTNDHGNFRWARGGNFGASARKVRLVEGGKVLEAELNDGSGGWKRSWIRLDERITNDNGELKYLD